MPPRLGESASLETGTPKDTFSLDNGGHPGAAYSCFSLRLPGPFGVSAGIGLPPVPDSLATLGFGD